MTVQVGEIFDLHRFYFLRKEACICRNSPFTTKKKPMLTNKPL